MCIEAYAAGLLDGDGSIYINSPQKSFGGLLIVSFTMGDKEPLDLLASRWGGNISVNGRTSIGRVIYRWAVSGRYAVDFLKEIEPWVFGKAAQAKVALTYPIGKYQNTGTPSEVVETRREIGRELHMLKQPGN